MVSCDTEANAAHKTFQRMMLTQYDRTLYLNEGALSGTTIVMLLKY